MDRGTYWATVHKVAKNRTRLKGLSTPAVRGFPGGISVNNLPVNAEDSRQAGLIPESGRSPGVFLPGKFHGQRSLMGHSPWGHKESDMTQMSDHSAYMSVLISPFISLPLPSW